MQRNQRRGPSFRGRGGYNRSSRRESSMWALLGISRTDLVSPNRKLKLSDLKPANSGWGKTAKGLEGVSALKAKAVGLFAAPGAKLDPKLTPEDIKKRLDTNIVMVGKPIEDSPLTPLHSKVSKVVIIKNIGDVSLAIISSFLKNYIKNFGYQDDVELIISSSNKDIIVETPDSILATILFSLAGKNIVELGSSPLELQRPNEFIQFDDPLNSNNELSDSLTESPRLLCCNNLPGELVSRDELLTKLTKYGELKSLKVFGNMNTMFLEYKTPEISDIIKILREKESLNVFPVCVNNDTNYIQIVRLTSSNFRQLVSNKTPEMTRHKESAMIQFLNMITIDDLMNTETYHFICKTLESDFSTFDGFVKLEIPKPNEKPTLNDMNLKYGKVLVKFESPKQATICLRALSGKLFCNRTVIGGYIDELDFDRHII